MIQYPTEEEPPKTSHACPKRFKHVFEFRISLKRIKPPIWRRIQVPEIYSFWDLHVAIQDSMGWLDCHLHRFQIKNPTVGVKEVIGIPIDEGFEDEEPDEPGWELKIAPYFTFENPKADYLYDFGDGWEHSIRLERILPRDKKGAYPKCVGGKRACPPEDCGGVWAYEEIINGEAKDEESGEPYYPDFDPERFDPNQVIFDDPDKRWRVAFQDEE